MDAGTIRQLAVSTINHLSEGKDWESAIKAAQEEAYRAFLEELRAGQTERSRAFKRKFFKSLSVHRTA